MKNATRLLALFFVAATTFFASCSDDTDTPSSLSGTTWVAQNQITDTAYDGTVISVQTIVWQLTFVDGTSGMLDTKTQRDSEQPEEYRFPISYTYSLSGSTGSGSIVIEDPYGSGENLSVSFTVNGDKLTLYNTGNGDIVFTRQSSSPAPATTGLEGTTWQTTFSQPYLDDDDNEHDGNITITIAFANSYSGTMRAEYIVPDIPSAGYDDGGTFSYSYTAPNGTINLPFADAELSFTIDGDDLTLVMGPNRVYTLHKI